MTLFGQRRFKRKGDANMGSRLADSDGEDGYQATPLCVPTRVYQEFPVRYPTLDKWDIIDIKNMKTPAVVLAWLSLKRRWDAWQRRPIKL